MQEVINGVTDQQKELLLRGLRFVRSSVKLGMSSPSDKASEDRPSDLAQVEALIAQIDSIGTAADC